MDIREITWFVSAFHDRLLERNGCWPVARPTVENGMSPWPQSSIPWSCRDASGELCEIFERVPFADAHEESCTRMDIALGTKCTPLPSDTCPDARWSMTLQDVDILSDTSVPASASPAVCATLTSMGYASAHDVARARRDRYVGEMHPVVSLQGRHVLFRTMYVCQLHRTTTCQET